MMNGKVQQAVDKIQELYERLLQRKTITLGIKTKEGVQLFY